MKNKRIGLFFVATITIVFAPACQAPKATGLNTEILYQYSTIGSLLEGVYDGEITFAELKDHGDMGLGTYNALDGEMIELDHRFYQIKSDGVVYEVDDKKIGEGKIGSVTKEIRDEFFAVVQGKRERYSDWLMQVYE